MGKISGMNTEQLKAKIKWAIERGCRLVRNEIVQNHLSGPKMPRGVGDEWNATLQPQSGYLRNSVQTKVDDTAKGLTGIVYVANVEYALIHETGGTKIMPGRGVVRIPRRPYMKPSLAVKADEVIEMVNKSLQEALRG